MYLQHGKKQRKKESQSNFYLEKLIEVHLLPSLHAVSFPDAVVLHLVQPQAHVAALSPGLPSHLFLTGSKPPSQ